MSEHDVPAALLARTLVTRQDEMTFLGRICVAGILTSIGGWLALRSSVLPAMAGVLLLAAMMVHWVELAHQCLHHSAFRSARPHRPVGMAMSLPFLVSFSHYRVRHLQHHKNIGTAADTAFFDFDTRQHMTFSSFLRELLNYGRVVSVARSTGQSLKGEWRYSGGQISPKTHRYVTAEYRIIGAFLAILVIAVALGGGQLVLRLWLLPFLLATPLHFLIELPEHIYCDSDSRNILRNTRSITGSRFSRWFTNSNNLHVEHHLAMLVPLQKLSPRHPLVQAHGTYVLTSYPVFYQKFLHSLSLRRRQSQQAPREPAFYHAGSLELQREFGTERLAQHIADRYVAPALSTQDVSIIEAADCFYLATADADGRPDCSYKGGFPGFVRVTGPHTFCFPSYDGNGMFRSLGNIRANPAVGLLFIDPGRPVKLRINGAASVHTDPARTSEFIGAEAVVEVRVRNIFENCPRYLHDRVTGQHSKHCPRENYQPPDPEWKKKSEYDGMVRRFDDAGAPALPHVLADPPRRPQ
ncbi:MULTISPECIES: fatty acid desaturase [unclassified Frankia]|uniref:fatty acid desaturase n=1 Tax=unclassified Frankia TaxID=2632575 RepID=UPI001EF5237A|nr:MULTISPECIES: fatty acid desaturase [unclassified Frankia]